MSDTSATQCDLITPDTDLYCLQCGYNLRGLPGDPRRCPECFHLNAIGKLVVPAAQIRKQTRKMETAPAWCIGAILIAGVGVLVAFGPFSACAAVLIPVAMFVWFSCAAAFAGSCQDKSGWRIALARYHFYGLTMVAIMFILWPGVIWQFLVVLLEPPHEGAVFVNVASAGLLAVSAVVLFPRMYRRARRDFDQLQRAVAIDIIRTHHRRQLEQQR